MSVEYLPIIHRYISPDSPAYSLYIIHVTLVTNKALQAARRLGLGPGQQRFIEEASMLHDIGICRVKAPEIFCFGDLPYIAHVSEGAAILRAEGLERHARVVESHTGVGIRAEDIRDKKLPLAQRDYLPETIEEEIISWADLFFSKPPEKVWLEHSEEQLRAHYQRLGSWHVERLEYLLKKFSDR